MIRRISSPFFLLAALGAVAFAANLPAAWRSWRFSRAIDSRNYSGPAEIAIPVDLFSRSQNHLSDLRLIDENGSEIPYVLSVERADNPLVRSSPAKLHENSFVPGQFTQIILEVQTDSLFHNTVRVDTPEADFMNWVEVAASDDTRLWRIVKERTPISRFRKEGLEGNQTIHYSDTSARFLRLRIQEPAYQFPVTSVQVLAYETREPERTPVPAQFQMDSSAPAGMTRWTADLQTNAIPITELAFTTATPEFFRPLRLSTSSDGKEWLMQAGGEIYRYKLGNTLEESLRVRFSESSGARFWRAEVLNGNNTPLSDVTLSLLMAPRKILFQAMPQRIYRLLYGNAKAAAPQYDLQRIFAYQGKPAALILQPGLEEATANYADPRPYTERHPRLLWVALGVAVALLGFAAVRALRAPSPPAPQ